MGARLLADVHFDVHVIKRLRQPDAAGMRSARAASSIHRHVGVRTAKQVESILG
jgi:hypothetical protein